MRLMTQDLIPFILYMSIIGFIKLLCYTNLKQVLAATPHKTPTVRPPAPYHENYSDMQDTAG